jgi:hypothetical protein
MKEPQNLGQARQFGKQAARSEGYLQSEIQSPILLEVALVSTLVVRLGTLPILLTVPDDGDLAEIDSVVLPLNPKARPRDIAVRSLAEEIFTHVSNVTGEQPTLVMQLVHRSRITPQIQDYMARTVVAYASTIAHAQAMPLHPAIHLDLHGFTKQTVYGEFDLILGLTFKLK